jgi:hypothetical protein
MVVVVHFIMAYAQETRVDVDANVPDDKGGRGGVSKLQKAALMVLSLSLLMLTAGQARQGKARQGKARQCQCNAMLMLMLMLMLQPRVCNINWPEVCR